MRTGFAMVPDWVIQRVTDGTAMRVYLHLAYKYADADRQAFPEMGTLADELGVSDRTVKRAVAVLQAANAIQVSRARQSDGYFGRNFYTLPLDDPSPGGTNMAPGVDQQECLHGPDMTHGDMTDLTPGSDQGKQGVSAGHDQGTNMAPPGGDKYGPSKEQPDPEKQPETSSSETADAASDQKPRDDVEQLCVLLHDRLIDNGCKVNPVGKLWRNSARLLLDRDKRPLDEALDVLAWSQDDEFWRANIRSMPKFREQYDALRLKWQKTNPVRYLRSEDAIRNWLREQWRQGHVKGIEDRSGLRYTQPDLPEGINTVDQARKFHADAVRSWITENHERVVELIQQREQPAAS